MSQPRRLPDGRWMARYSAPPVNGKRRQPRVYGRTRKECEFALAAALAGLSGVPGKVSSRDKYEDHLDRRLRQWELETGDQARPRCAATGKPSSCISVPGWGISGWPTWVKGISGIWLRP